MAATVPFLVLGCDEMCVCMIVLVWLMITTYTVTLVLLMLVIKFQLPGYSVEIATHTKACKNILYCGKE
jgi:hypothetical protein